jgi:hypothetical protein
MFILFRFTKNVPEKGFEGSPDDWFDGKWQPLILFRGGIQATDCS